jgi:hypothetical protein
MELDVRLLQLADGGLDLVFDCLGAAGSSTRGLGRVRGFTLQPDDACRIRPPGGSSSLSARLAQQRFEPSELLDVLSVNPLRHIFQGADRLEPRLGFRESEVSEVEQRHGWREPLGRPGSEKLLGLVQCDYRRKSALV